MVAIIVYATVLNFGCYIAIHQPIKKFEKDTRISQGSWDWKHVSLKKTSRSGYAKWGGFLDSIEFGKYMVSNNITKEGIVKDDSAIDINELIGGMKDKADHFGTAVGHIDMMNNKPEIAVSDLLIIGNHH